MRIGDEQTGYEILVLRCHAGAAFAATTLRTIGRQRYTLDITGMADGDDHIFASDEVFIVHFGAAKTKLGTARRGELVTNGNHLFLDDCHNANARARISR